MTTAAIMAVVFFGPLRNNYYFCMIITTHTLLGCNTKVLWRCLNNLTI